MNDERLIIFNTIELNRETAKFVIMCVLLPPFGWLLLVGLFIFILAGSMAEMIEKI